MHYKTRFYLGKALFKLGTDTQNPETLRTAAMHLNMFASRHRDDATEAAKAAAVLALRAFNMAERLRKLRKATAAIEQAA